MEPMTTIAAASMLIKALGLDEKLGRLLGGDKGAEVASKVVEVASVVTGASSTEEALQIVEQRHETFLQLKTKLLDLADKEADRELNDRASARAMQIAALQQDDHEAKRFVYRFAWFWSAFTTLYILMITFVSLPEGAQRFADTVLGFLLGTVVATILTYFYGSSVKSRQKDLSIEALTSQLSEMKKGP